MPVDQLLCAWGEHCAARIGKMPAVAVRSGPLCGACLAAAGNTIGALPGAHAQLGRELSEASLSAGYGGVPGDPATRAPLSLGIDALQREILWALTVWEPPVREAARLAPELTRTPAGWPVRDADAVEMAAGVLTRHVDLLAALGPIWGYAEGIEVGPVARDGLDALRTFAALHRRASRVTGIFREEIHLPGECLASSCRATDLRRSDGSDTVRCAVCGFKSTYDDYSRNVGFILAKLEAS